MDIETKLIHSGFDRNLYHGASSLPIFQISTYHQKDPECLGEYGYSRCNNPTRQALENAIAELEGGQCGFAFASGIAAISSVFMLFQPGDHLIVSNDVYGGTHQVLTTVFKQWGLKTSFVDSTDLAAIQKAITPQTKAIFVETPSNPILKITDLAAIAEIAHSHKLYALTDNTFMSPFLQNPLELGFDIVIHSATKYICGHSDVVAGLAVTKDAELGKRLRNIQIAFGAILGPHDSWLALRGIKTLGVRMRAQQENAGKMAQWLSEQQKVKKVYYPGLKTHPGREIHFKQAKGGGAVISFELESTKGAVNFLRSVKIPLVAVSLGGVESILSYPVTMSHALMPRLEREERGINGALVRFSVGMESTEDMMKDFSQAFSNS
ncbi:MAG: cystathionine gamma-synthase [Planctomycetes bacterium GWF2_42_9]|nr:MAG: cystathionine gamma-synthase [Planctomycetes bacterium GWF2_42_9]HAL45207.1 methionine biosynthesis PLP-dependent protein [Phycisphaerales bacterium]